LSWNGGAERIFGYEAAEAIGRNIRIIIPPDRQGEEDDVLAHVRRGEKLDHFETVRRSKDGREVHISLTVSPVRDNQGRIIGASKVARDITQRKRSEEEREQLLAMNEAALRKAEEANRLKEDFLATVSHELRNPLTSILGWAALLEQGKLDAEKTARAVAAIQRSAQAQDQLIGDLLDISRIVAGRLRLDVQPFLPIEALEAALESIGPAVEAKRIRLHVVLDPSAGPILGDPARLQQVFWNLLSNAVKFTPREGHVEVFLRRIDSHIEAVVSDTGIGITPELLPFVFDRFRQGDSGTSRRTGGLGLGLAIARSLIELHGGELRAESKGLGQGAAFTVRLPLMSAQRPLETQQSIHPASGGNEKAPSLKGLRVLLVDDEESAREVVSLILSQADAQVRTAESAAAALNILDQWRPDILVSDVGMPQVDGYDLIRLIRARPAESGGSIPAAALTAYARTEDRLRVLSAGYQTHVQKPVQPIELITVVASLARRF
jgi:PAS domain S-box-containing protein